MTEADLEKLLAACKATPCIKIGSYTGSTPQENANRAWAELGSRMGFDSDTVQPIEGKSMRAFTAVPTENETQRAERQEREALEAKAANIARLELEVEAAKQRLAQALT